MLVKLLVGEKALRESAENIENKYLVIPGEQICVLKKNDIVFVLGWKAFTCTLRNVLNPLGGEVDHTWQKVLFRDKVGFACLKESEIELL